MSQKGRFWVFGTTVFVLALGAAMMAYGRQPKETFSPRPDAPLVVDGNFIFVLHEGDLVKVDKDTMRVVGRSHLGKGANRPVRLPPPPAPMAPAIE